jgi:small-conductance mechanosensitive channel
MLNLRKLALPLTAILALNAAVAADSPTATPTPAAGAATNPAAQRSTRAVMNGEQVVQILDETVDWYRTLGAQQQSATQPSDLLILYANRQTADKVVNLAFEIARANAELISSDADNAQKAEGESTSSSLKSLLQIQQQLDTRRTEIQSELKQTPEQTKQQELQSELDLINARRNLLGTMSQFIYQSDANGSGASALKEHIDAIAASIPSAGNTANAAPVASANGTAAAAAAPASSGGLIPTQETSPRRLGIWDLTSNVLRLQSKINTIDAIDTRTAALQETFKQIRTPPLEQIKALSARGDELAKQADTATGTELKGVRTEFDTLAWLFKQTAAILVPLSQEGVLLEQYRHNLKSWRDTTINQYHDALTALAKRVGLLLVLLAIVFAAGALWRSVVFRYAHDPRRRYQFLLVRKIVLSALVVAIIGFTFATEIGSLATFAGLITAGLAVAMQSVLVSFVGYFFLIGKYGIRVGDRVQIGNVNGEVIELGLVRLHLMELSNLGPLGPTGRVVAFANSIVFQASGGIFKQISGVNLAWHDITLRLPPAADFTVLKEKLAEAANRALSEYREDIVRQTQEIQKTSSSHAIGEAYAQVQLRFSADAVDAVVRYPVQIQRAAEIDEHVSRELMEVVKAAAR